MLPSAALFRPCFTASDPVLPVEDRSPVISTEPTPSVKFYASKCMIRVAELLKLTRPVMRPRARLYPNQARCQLGNQFQQFAACDAVGRISTALPLASTPCTAKTFLARSIPTVTMVDMGDSFIMRWSNKLPIVTSRCPFGHQHCH